MPTVKETTANMHKPEHRLLFEPESPEHKHVILSGSVDVVTLQIHGIEDESFEEYEVHMRVGPWWKDVQSCVPFVTINHWDNTNSDEDDSTGGTSRT